VNRLIINLQPDEQTTTQNGKVIDRIVRFCHQIPFLNVDRVVKAGSSGKGTTVRGISDIDLVVFINTDLPMITPEEWLKPLLESLEKHVKNNLEGCKNFKIFPHSLKFTCEELDVDLLPAPKEYSNPEKIPVLWFSVIVTQVAVDFVQKRADPKCKDLIRVLKHWRNLTWRETRSGRPSSYLIELVMISCYDEGLMKVELLVKCMQLFSNFSTLSITWDNKQHSFQEPIVLDPSNTRNNLAKGFCGQISFGVLIFGPLEENARETLNTSFSKLFLM